MENVRLFQKWYDVWCFISSFNIIKFAFVKVLKPQSVFSNSNTAEEIKSVFFSVLVQSPTYRHSISCILKDKNFNIRRICK